MQPREAAVFAIGFAAGALCLAVLLGAAGGLKVSPHATPVVAHAAPELQPPVPNPTDFSVPPSPLPPVVPPPVDSVATSHEADRMILPAPGLMMPVRGVKLSQLVDNYQEIRDGHKHEALDIPAPRGAAVVAVNEGNVVKLFTSKQGGLTIYQFDNSAAWCYYYAHLDRYAPNLREGMLLRKGDIIGYVGTTGDAPANAPHLHFAIFRLGPEKKWWQGTAVDPLPLLKGE